MVRIRLRRVGAKKQPSYRIVVADQRSPRDGRFIETIGHYNPRTEPETVNYDEERALYWLSVGAQPTEAVRRLLGNGGTYARLERLRQGESIEALVEEALAEAEKSGPVSPKTRHATPKSSRKKEEEAEEEAVEAEAVEVEAAKPEADEVKAEVEAVEVEAAKPEADEVEAEVEAVEIEAAKPEADEVEAEVEAVEVEAAKPEADEVEAVAEVADAEPADTEEEATDAEESEPGGEA